MENIKVSIVMPIHNRYEFLKEAVESLLKQTFTDFELICVDDGSDEHETIEYLRLLENEYSLVRVIKIEKATGAGNARNVGLDAAQGKYVMFLDSDDVFDVMLLEKMYSKITEEKADIVFNGYRGFTDYEGIRKLYPVYYMSTSAQMNDTSNELWIHNMMKNPWTKMFRTQYLRDNKIFFQNISSCNDVAFSILANVLTSRYAFVEDKPLIQYRVSETQISRKRNPLCAYEATVYLENELKKRNLFIDEGLRHQFLVFMFLTCLYEMTVSKDSDNNMILYKKMMDYFAANPVEFYEQDTVLLIKKYTSEIAV